MLEKLQVLQVETTNVCNANCSGFCRAKEQKTKGYMSDELFNKIVKEASELPKLRAFIPLLNGEPFCDKKLVDRMRRVREAMPKVEIKIYTNGSFLTEDILRELADIKGVFLTVSLNAYYKLTRAIEMGLDDFEHVVKMIQTAFDYKIPLQATMVDVPSITWDEKQRFKEQGGILAECANWAGTDDYTRPENALPCRRMLHHMPITYDGWVPVCCFDPCAVDTTREFTHMFYGNVEKDTIADVWNSYKHNVDVNLHLHGEHNIIQLCNTCNHEVICDNENTIDDYHSAQIQELFNNEQTVHGNIKVAGGTKEETI